jgi:AcrR family transcriptional regulator
MTNRHVEPIKTPMSVTEIMHNAAVTARTRNAAATRAAILCAARQRFRSEGYDEVGMRDIARDAGCDPALVSRYFGSKEDLFREVLTVCGDGGECLMEVPRERFGAHYARQLVYENADCEGMEPVLIMLRASGSAKAAELVRRATVDDFLKPFAAWLGGEKAQARAFLASSLVMGFALNRSLSGDEGVPEEEREALCAKLAAVLQACVD